ncbi:unnamed protein product [Cyprideis torosa]|uniref:Uncharacterized protein n=1 Tax=Cyprideis torosa TaxID=163714 RepID=A0A7R8WGZ8_9CRUS|nr:unnamed protein product [Cyprideis torosa]CAG0893575.1 unnamed protein product [Cyprideis torosa]
MGQGVILGDNKHWLVAPYWTTVPGSPQRSGSTSRMLPRDRSSRDPSAVSRGALGNIIRMTPERCSMIIMAACVMHKLAIEAGDIDEDVDDVIIEVQQPPMVPEQGGGGDVSPTTRRVVEEWQNPALGIPGRRTLVTPKAYPAVPVINGQDIATFRVIGQFNRSFILVQDEERLVMMDQHAAHERVRLEGYLKTCSSKFPPHNLHSPLPLPMSAQDQRLLLDVQLKRKMNALSFGFGPSPSADAVHVTQIPLVIWQKEKTEVSGQSSVMTLIDELVVLDAAERTTINSGCAVLRGALKAGDELKPSEMEQLLYDLKKCDHPFQCAHGRPTMLSLQNLEAFVNASTHSRNTHWISFDLDMLGCDDPDPSNSLLGSILQPSNLLTDTSSGDSSCREQGGGRYFISTPDLVSFSLENNGSDHPVHSWRTLDYSGVKYEQQQTDQLSLHEGNDESSSQTTSTDAPGAFLIRNGTSSGDGNRGENSTRPEILNHDQGPSHVSSAAEILAELCMEDLFMPPSSNAWSSSVVGAFDRPPPPPYPFTTTSSQINESQIPSSISSDSPSSQANTKPSSSSPSTAIAVASSAEHYTPPKQLATPVACVICGEIFNSDMELELHHTSHSQRDLAKALTSMTRSACNLNPLTSLGPSSTFLFSTPLTPPIPSPSPTPPPNESHQNSSITTSCKTTFTRSSVSCNQTEDSSSLPSFSSTSSASSALLGNNSLLLPGGVQISPVPASLNPPVTTSSPLSFLNLLLQNQTSNPSPHKSITFTSPSTVSPLKPPSSNLLPPPPPYPLAAKTLSSAPFCSSTAVTSLSSPPPNASHSDSVKIADGPSSTADATSVTAKKSLKPSRQPIPCPVCGKVLANQGNMKKHMTVHEDALDLGWWVLHEKTVERIGDESGKLTPVASVREFKFQTVSVT